MKLDDLWAKTEPWQSLETHSKVSGIVAQVLLDRMLARGTVELLAKELGMDKTTLSCFVGYFVSCHDAAGKCTPNFQALDLKTREKLQSLGINLLPVGPENHPRHEIGTQRIMERIWRAQGMEKSIARFLSGILGKHHQGKQGNVDPELAQMSAEQDALDRLLRQFFYEGATPVWPVVQRQQQGIVGSLLLGITILADWIASGSPFASADGWKADLRQQTEKQARWFLHQSGLERQQLFLVNGFCDAWPNIPREGMRPLQQQMETLIAQTEEKIALVLLEAPMGEGKTEAGMYAALKMAQGWQKDGFYVALPTAATSNQMVGRMRALLHMHAQENNVRLLHAMAWLVEEQSMQLDVIQTEDERSARKWLEPLRRGMLESNAVGTVDQAMLAVMMVKYGVLRLLGLAGKVLVIDEIHAYDTYMSGILRCLLQWCKALEIPVVLLSATLPPAKKQQLLSVFTDESLHGRYPAITAVTATGRLIEQQIPACVMKRRLQVRLCPILHDAEKISDLAEQLTAQGGCLCVLLNTVAQAQEVYRVLRTRQAGQVLLFHAAFPAGRRDEIEAECLRLFGKDKSNRPERAILVATQIVEMSLDLDFDILMTAIAPIDLLLQRAGREWRHRDTLRPAHLTAPVLYVLTPADGNYDADQYIYPACLLAQSEHLLEMRTEIRIPEDMAQLVADGYDESKAPPEQMEAWLEQMIEDGLHLQKGENGTWPAPPEVFHLVRDPIPFDDLEQDSFLSAKTRLGEPTVRIALLEQDLFEKVSQLAQTEHGKRVAPVRETALARAVLRQSVSVRKKRLAGFVSDESMLEGRGRLDWVRIYPAQDGVYTAPDGKQIVFDRELGVLIKDGEK